MPVAKKRNDRYYPSIKEVAIEEDAHVRVRVEVLKKEREKDRGGEKKRERERVERESCIAHTWKHIGGDEKYALARRFFFLRYFVCRKVSVSAWMCVGVRFVHNPDHV